MLLLLFLLLLSTGAACNKRIAVAVDVSGSISVDPVTGKQRPGPTEIRAALKRTMEQYLFRDAGACVAIYRFATNASLVSDFAPVAEVATRQRLLAAVETLPFEMSYPGYFTNWEAAIQTVLDGRLGANWLYLVTDSSPTYSSDGQDHSPVERHVGAAVRVSKLLQKSGTGVVGVGMGPDVRDAHLAAISGPCGGLGCFKGWNYFHVDSMSRADIPLGQSIHDRFLSNPALDEKAVRLRQASGKGDNVLPSFTIKTLEFKPTIDGPVTAKNMPFTKADAESSGAATTTKRTILARETALRFSTHAGILHRATRRPLITREEIARHAPENLSGGAIVAIVVGCCLGFVILAFVFWLFMNWCISDRPGDLETFLSTSPVADSNGGGGQGKKQGRLPPVLYRTR